MLIRRKNKIKKRANGISETSLNYPIDSVNKKAIIDEKNSSKCTNKLARSFSIKSHKPRGNNSRSAYNSLDSSISNIDKNVKKRKKERFTQSGAEQTSLDENNISNKAKKVKKSWYIIIGSLIFIFGISLISIDFINPYLKEKEEEKSLEQFYIQEEKKEDKIDKTTSEEVKEESKPKVKYDYIAVLKIPKINLEKGIVAKDSKYNNINYGVEILKESDSPDVINGNVILAAHSGTANISYFRNLDKINVGDEVVSLKNGVNYVSIVNIQTVNETVNYYHVITTRYFNMIAEGLLTTYEINNEISSNYKGFDNDFKWVNYTPEDKKISYEAVLNTFGYVDKYLYKAMKMEDFKYAIEQGYITQSALESIINTYMRQDGFKVIPPKDNNGKYLWMVTTSDDNNPSNISHQMVEDSEYTVPTPKNNNKFKYWYNHSDNKHYQPGEKIIVDSSMYLEAIYE